MIIPLTNMGGIAPKITPELLPEQLAQTAQNVVLHNGGVRSLKDAVTVATPTKAGATTSIYRYGTNEPETQYWFKWSSVVNVAKTPIAGDTEQTVYYTGDGVPKKTRFSLATGSGTDYPVAYYNLKVPAPTVAPVLTAVAGTGPTVREDVAYVFTNVTTWGEESAPSPAAISYRDATHVVEVNMSAEGVPSGSYSWASRRIYRTVTSSSGTNYYFVGEVAAGVSTFTDTTDVASIGEALPSLDWDTPPDDLQGLICLPSGAMCGFSENEVCFSVPNAPYAYPEKYRLTSDYPIVAVAPMGQGVVVLTTGYPYLINTGDPESAQMIRLDEEQSCVSARSVVPFSGGVIYASPDGLVLISQAGVKLLTQETHDRDAWQALTPSSIIAVKHDGRYYGFLSSGGFVFDPASGFYTHTITATAAYVDPVLDKLYVAIGSNIRKWDSGSVQVHTWKSKKFHLPKLTSFSCAQIKANSYASLTLKTYADGVLKDTRAVTSAAPFRVPTGYKSRIYEFEITGTDHWTMAHIASSMEELKNV